MGLGSGLGAVWLFSSLCGDVWFSLQGEAGWGLAASAVGSWPPVWLLPQSSRLLGCVPTFTSSSSAEKCLPHPSFVTFGLSLSDLPASSWGPFLSTSGQTHEAC